jgi:hypothetical protein
MIVVTSNPDAASAPADSKAAPAFGASVISFAHKPIPHTPPFIIENALVIT